MPWQGWPPAPARPMTGDGRPTNSLMISVIGAPPGSIPSRARPDARRVCRPASVVWCKTETDFRFRSVRAPDSGAAYRGPEEGFMEWRNEEFDLGGVNHLALVCSDMKRTVEFYTAVLG